MYLVRISDLPSGCEMFGQEKIRLRNVVQKLNNASKVS